MVYVKPRDVTRLWSPTFTATRPVGGRNAQKHGQSVTVICKRVKGATHSRWIGTRELRFFISDENPRRLPARLLRLVSRPANDNLKPRRYRD